MKISVLFLFLCVFGLSAENIYSQQKEVSVRVNNETIRQAISQIENRSDYVFLITDGAEADLSKRVSINASKESINEILSMLLKNTDLAYRLIDRQVMVYKSESNADAASESSLQQPPPVKIKGKVVDENGEELPGVSIYNKNKSVGTVSDINGEFQLELKNINDSISFSYVGFETIRIIPKSGQNADMRIVLIPASNQIEDVVVVAYGTADKRTYTGSVTAVSSEDIQRNRSNNVLNSLQGIAPGLRLENKALGSGQSEPEIVIRGASSINSSVRPLFIIDGVPSEAMNHLNPDDIESISVLKDAAAISLYGARATNGVILISTKKGRRMGGKKSAIAYSGQFGVSSRSGESHKLVEPKDYYELSWEAMRNGAQDNPGLLTAGGKNYASAEAYASGELLNTFGYNAYDKAQPVGLDGKLDPAAKLLWWENYDKELLKTAIRHEHNLSINDATDKFTYYLSGSYLYQDGIELSNNNTKRMTLRSNITYDISDKWKIGANLSMSKTHVNVVGINNSNISFVNYGRIIPGLYPMYKHDPQGNLVLDAEGNKVLDLGNGPADVLNSRRPDITSENDGVNPLSAMDLNNIYSDSRYYSMNFFSDYEIFKGLNFKALYSTDLVDNKNHSYTNRTIGHQKGKGLLNISTSEFSNWTVNGLLSYNKEWRNRQKLRITLGSEVNDKSVSTLNASGTGFAFEGMDELGNAATILTPPSGAGTSSTDRLIGFFSRVEYDILNRYFFSGSLRRDGSSRFHPDSRWGNFGSIGASWIISNEAFARNLTFLPYLKLRATYGTSRNIGTNDYRSYYSSGYSFLGEPAVYLTSLANKDLRWEINKQLNVGLDGAILDSRIRFSLDYYNRKTSDLFYNVPLAPSIGFSRVLRNIGSLRNTGLEFSITTENIKTTDFLWTTNFNISTNKNKILSLNQDEFVSGRRIYKVGQSTTEFYIPKYAGVNPENGKPQWYIQEMDEKTGKLTGKEVKTEVWNDLTSKTVTLADGTRITEKNLGKYSVGNFTPTVIGGFNNSFQFKNFDFSFLFNYSLGSNVIVLDYISFTNSGTNTINMFHEDMLQRWQKQGDVTDFPRLTTSRVNNYTGSHSYISNANP